MADFRQVGGFPLDVVLARLDPGDDPGAVLLDVVLHAVAHDDGVGVLDAVDAELSAQPAV